MLISIRNYRAIESAHIDLDGITLVAGPNGAGKTSISEALGALLTRSPVLVDGVLIKDAAALVRDGEKEAVADLQFGKGENDSINATWPKAKILGNVAAGPEASMVAVGQLRITGAAKLADRLAILSRYIPGKVTDGELSKEVAKAGYSEQSVAHVVSRVKEFGWDEIHSRSVTNGTQTKGAWEGITREKFGTSKAENWQPANYVDITDEQVDEAQAVYDAAVGAVAVAVDKVPALQATVDAATGLDITEADERVKTAQDALDVVEAERAALGDADANDSVPCPACGTHLVVRHDHNTKAVGLFEATETRSAAELKKLRLQIAAADGAVQRAMLELRTAESYREQVAKKIADGEAARAELESMAGVDTEAIATAKAALDDALARKANRKRIEDAAATFRRWKQNQDLINILAPEGLRRVAMKRDLEAFNKRLADLSAAAGWDDVTIEPDFSIAMGGRPYHLLSKSAQYRADVTLQVACAALDGSAMVIIDGADILDKAGRNGLFGMLRTAALRALVTMTFSAPALAPNLAAAGLGRSYWLQDGMANLIGGTNG